MYGAQGLSLCTAAFVCVHVCVCARARAHVCICVRASLSACLSVYVFTCLPVCLSATLLACSHTPMTVSITKSLYMHILVCPVQPQACVGWLWNAFQDQLWVWSTLQNFQRVSLHSAVTRGEWVMHGTQTRQCLGSTAACGLRILGGLIDYVLH